MQRLATIFGGVVLILATAYFLDVGWSALFTLADPLRLGLLVGGVVGAIFLGEFARLIRLPRIVGYLAVGVILGPFAAHFALQISLELPDVVTLFGDVSAIFTAAVALTGLAVGLRLRGSSIIANGKLIASSVAGQLILGIGATSAVLVGAAHYLDLTVPGLWPDSLVISAVVASLLVTTSGAVAIWGANSEFRAEGSFADIQIQVSAIKDGILAIAVVAFAGALLFDTRPEVFSEWLASFGLEVGLALGIGLGAGLVLLAALRWLPEQIVPVVVTLVVLAGMVAANYPGFTFIGAVVAGSVAASGSRFSHALTESIDRGSPFMLAIVFLHVGLLLDLPVDDRVWWVALVLVVVRAFTLQVGAMLAARLVDASDALSRHVPVAMTSQGLVVLLLALFTADLFPEGRSLLYVVAPVILLDAVIGPILQRASLVKMVKGRPAHPDVDAPRKGRASVSRPMLEETRSGRLDVEESLLPPANFEIPQFDSAPLTRLAERVRSRLERTMDRIATSYFDPRRGNVDELLDLVGRATRRHVRDTAEALRHQTDPDRRIEILRDRRRELDNTFLEIFGYYGHSNEGESLGTTLDAVFRDLQSVTDLPATLQAPELEKLWEDQPGDSIWSRLRKAAHRFTTRVGPAPMRSIPVRAVASNVLVHGVAARLEAAVNMIGHHRLYLWHKFEIAWKELDAMYERSLDQSDRDAGRDPEEMETHGPESDPKADELLEFDRRLASGEAARTLSEKVDADDSAHLLHVEERDTPDDLVSAYWRTKLEELSFEHEQLERDLAAFGRDTRRRMTLAFSESFGDFTHALERAGTFLLPTRSLAPRGVSYHSDSEERAKHAAQHWLALVSAYLDRRSMRLHLRILQARIHPTLDDAVNEISRELASRLTYYPAEISMRCDEVVAQLSASIEADASVADLLDAVVQIRSDLSTFLQDDALYSLHELRHTNRFSELLRGFVDELESLVAREPETFFLPSDDLLDLDETESAAHVDHVALPYRKILERSFLAALSASIGELDLRVRAAIDRVSSGLGEVNRVVSFNLGAAASELRSAGDDDEEAIELVSEFAIGGLRRAGQSASELLDTIQGEIEWVEKSLVDITVTHLKEATEFLLDEDAAALAAKAREASTAPLPSRGRRLFEKAQKGAKSLVGRVSEPVGRLLAEAEERLSFDDGDYDDLQAAADVADFEHPTLERLPNAYRRLFAPVPVEIPEIFVGRSEHRDRIDRAIARWKEGHRTAIVVTGELGIGRTSFLHRVLAEELSEVEMIRWNLRDRVVSERTFAEQLASLFGLRHIFDTPRLANALGEVEGPRLVLLDGLENLYLRDIDGADTFRALMTVASSAPADILWVATCSASMFTHLSNHLGARDLFADEIELGTFDRDQLEELIMRRHHVSGYRLQFLAAGEEPLPQRLKEKSQQRMQRRYFDRLYDLTDGHPLLALFHWQCSIETTEVEDTLVCRPPRAMRTGHIRHLGDERHIALGQILLHEELSEESFATVMGVELDDARRRLAFLENLGLVVRSAGRRDALRLNPVLHRDVRRALSERNIV